MSRFRTSNSARPDRAEQTDAMRTHPLEQPLLVVLSAPSGAGKTTLCQQLLEARPAFARAITCTTRPPRTGERDGVDYHFLTPEHFQERLDRGDFLEHATVYNRSYGTLRSEVIATQSYAEGLAKSV